MPSDRNTPQWKQQFRRRLNAWYRRHARDLAWRQSRDPYRVWISEIMLQQTQVATVEPYFDRFVAEFPTVKALAAADEEQVLRLWEGLGYYRRARHLHQAAQVIEREHGGNIPRDLEAARRLPGIGRYTAGAILSIAYDARTPILEANTVRLLSRLIAYRGDPTKAAGQRLLWQTSTELLPRRNVGQFNQALMELGSRVCTPRTPGCRQCPVAKHCLARAGDLVERIPAVRPKRPPTDVHEAAVVVRRGRKVLLVQNDGRGRWAGLWDFPRFELDDRPTARLSQQLIAGVKKLTGVLIEPSDHLTTIRHGVTRFRITLDGYWATYVSRSAGSNGFARVKWIEPAELESVPLSTTGRKLSRLISGPNGASP